MPYVTEHMSMQLTFTCSCGLIINYPYMATVMMSLKPSHVNIYYLSKQPFMFAI